MTQEERIEEFIQNSYKEYVKTYKQNNYDVHYKNYEWWYQDLEDTFTDLFVCNNCNEVCTEKGTSELALQDCICEECMKNGYGQ
jgi:hypothetical protein